MFRKTESISFFTFKKTKFIYCYHSSMIPFANNYSGNFYHSVNIIKKYIFKPEVSWLIGMWCLKLGHENPGGLIQ